jgi:sterol desaturase/sphingolipid hydroxylase (fatty acid hydroxylase superfamily)
MTALAWIIALFAGWFLWIAGEYHLHRFAMHHLKGRGLASREHLLHHAHPDRTDPFTRFLGYLGVVVVGAAIGGLIRLAAGPTIGIGVAVGWTIGYLFYEMMHWRAHARPPRGRYDLWLRRHHFHHHFGHPMANHGVTTSLWDHVYGTFERPDRIRVPRRLAMGWLVEQSGAVREDFRTDYVLAGRPPERTDDAGSAGDAGVTEDERRAFANQAPAA